MPLSLSALPPRGRFVSVFVFVFTFVVVVVALGCLAGAARAAGEGAAGVTGVALEGATPMAEVFLDGDRVGVTPLQGALPCQPGEHTLRVTRPGFAPYVDVFKAREGRVTRVEVELVPVAGVLKLKANVTAAQVYIDQQYAGAAPLEAEVKIGPHQVRVTRFGYREEIFQITAKAGEVLEQKVRLQELPPELNPYKPPPPPPPKWYERWWVWTAGAAGVAALAVGVIVPAVLATRPECDKAGAEFCVSVPAPMALRF